MKMNRASAMVASMLAAAAVARAGDGPTVRFVLTPLSQYSFRGMMMTNGPVLQASATAEYRGAHVTVFTNQDMDRVNARRWKVGELDLDAGYDYTREKATISGGVIRYTFPNTTYVSTTELYAGVSSSLPLHPSVRGFFDVDAFNGVYVTFDAYHGVTLYRARAKVKWEAVLSAGAGLGSANHNVAYYGARQAGMADVHPTLTLPLTLGRWKLTPTLGYVTLLTGALRRGFVPQAHNFFGGVGLAFTL